MELRPADDGREREAPVDLDRRDRAAVETPEIFLAREEHCGLSLAPEGLGDIRGQSGPPLPA